MASLLLLVAGSWLGDVEIFTVAEGSPRFGKNPLIAGNIVIWKRYSPGGRLPDMVQGRDISHYGNPVLDILPYPASRTGLLLTSEFLFWPSSGSSKGPIWARRTEHLLRGSGNDIVVCASGGVPITATSHHVFIKRPGAFGEPGNIFAKAIRDLDSPCETSLQLVVTYKELPLIARTEGASDKYFVWQDRDPAQADDTWKIYAKRTSELFVAGAERVLVDTQVPRDAPTQRGIQLAIDDNILVFQAISGNGKCKGCLGIFLLNIDSNQQFKLAESYGAEDYTDYLHWPDVSKHYAIWTREVGLFVYVPYAIALFEGRPFGEAFAISDADHGGQFARISGNLVVWNGDTSFNGAEFFHNAILGAELPVQGADDVGDVDGDGRIDITDAVNILGYLFLNGWQPRLRLADANLNQRIDLDDAVRILNYLFQGDPRPGGA